MKYITFFFMMLLCHEVAYTQQGCKIEGVVTSKEDGQPIVNVTVIANGISFSTDSIGRFNFFNSTEVAEILFKHIGYISHSVKVSCPQKEPIRVPMEKQVTKMDSIVVSTGYEQIPRERATGSFEVVDSKLLNRAVGTNVLARLENVTTGMHFAKQDGIALGAGLPITSRINLHGVSTLRDWSNRSAPLVILDNFPYEGNLNDINPADIESVTILKDAAASSIWGAKAGNGVLVLTSKQASRGEGIKVNFGVNYSMHQKPDLMRHQVISPRDYIDIEKSLFINGHYRSLETSRSRPALSPVVELLIAERDGTMTSAEVEQQIQLYGNQDVRNDFLKYMMRNAFLQQYNLGITGNTGKNRFVLSGGYDNSLPTQRGREYSRGAIRVDNTYSPIKNLDVTTSVRWSISQSLNTDGVPVYSETGYKYPYIRFADDRGNPLPVPKDYRLSYLDHTGDGLLLDWHFRPIEEIANQPIQDSRKELIFNAGIRYRFNSWLDVDMKYQYTEANEKLHALYDMGNYKTRNLINLGSAITNEKVTYQYPYGSILENDYFNNIGKYGRIQTNVNKSWSDIHRLNALAGFEWSDRKNSSNGYTIVGYDENTLTYPTNIDYVKPYSTYDNLFASGMIGHPFRALTEQTQRFVSYFMNASYSYYNRYVLSMSARRDASNLFGVATNDKWSPLWSIGAKWNLDNEAFYTVGFLPKLGLRATYGYSGNIDNSLSAVPTLSYLSPSAATLVPWSRAQILNAPNALLRWEKVRTINLGIDFSTKNNILQGTIDIYQKYTGDLYTSTPLDPTTGINAMVINGANTKGRGIDIRLHTLNLNGAIKWDTNWLFTYNNTWITRNYKDYSNPTDLITANLNMVEGHLAFPMYSYRWGGLDPETGEPRGVFDGTPSKDYRQLRSSDVKPEDLIFHGSRRPLYWGAIRNSLSYKNMMFSANISWKAGYYFRRESINYQYVVNNGMAHMDYYKRWQNPGDEKDTYIPAFVYPINTQANSFYANSEVLVERGDHIRLEDIRLDYSFSLLRGTKINVNVMASNLGILWRANKHKQDPDHGSSIPMPRAYSLGLSFNY